MKYHTCSSIGCFDLFLSLSHTGMPLVPSIASKCKDSGLLIIAVANRKLMHDTYLFGCKVDHLKVDDYMHVCD